MIEQLVGSPVIASIAGATTLPFEPGINTAMAIDGRPDTVGTVEWRAITPDYFQALAIPLRAGRAFTPGDGAADARVAIVNETFARRYFADGGAIGRRIEVGRAAGRAGGTSQLGPGIEIVGIAADIRDASLRSEPRRTIYVPQAQAPAALANVLGTMPVFIAQPRFDPGDAGRAVAEALRAVDVTLPRPDIVPLDEVVSRSLARERFGAALLTALAALALALTALGIHGVLAYAVQQRRREIGIRLALGAGGAQVVRMLIVHGIAPVLIGLIAGLIGALALSRAIAGFLWGVTPTDPATLAAVASILLAVAVTASWLASRRAAADPINRLIPDP